MVFITTTVLVAVALLRTCRGELAAEVPTPILILVVSTLKVVVARPDTAFAPDA